MLKTRGCCFNMAFSTHVNPVQRQHHTWVLWSWAGTEGKGMDENKFAGNKDTSVNKRKNAAEKNKEFGRWQSARTRRLPCTPEPRGRVTGTVLLLRAHNVLASTTLKAQGYAFGKWLLQLQRFTGSMEESLGWVSSLSDHTTLLASSHIWTCYL